MFWHAQYSRWDLRDTGEVHQIWWSPHNTFIYLFIYFIYEVKSLHLSSLSTTNCSTFFHSSSNRMLETYSHFIPDLLICALVTSLCETSLTRLTHMNESVQLPLVSMKISFIYLFFVLGSRFTYVRLMPFILRYIMSNEYFKLPLHFWN